MKVIGDDNTPDKYPTAEEIRKDMLDTLEWYKEMRDEYTDDPRYSRGNTEVRSASEIAERIAILASMYPLRHTSDPEKRQEILSKIKRMFWFKLSPIEKEIIQNGAFEYHEEMVAGSYPQFIYVYLWILGQTDSDTLDPPDKLPYSPELDEKQQAIIDNPEAFIAGARTRTSLEVIEALIESYRLYIKGFMWSFYDDPEPEKVNYMIVANRFAALVWALGMGDWDEILYECFEDAYMHDNGREEEFDDDDWGPDSEDWEPDPNMIIGDGYVGIMLDPEPDDDEEADEPENTDGGDKE